MLFNVNSWEIVVLVALFVVLFGPDRLPKVMGQVVKLLRDLQEMSDSATSEIRRELEAATKAASLTGTATEGNQRPRRASDQATAERSQHGTEPYGRADDTEQQTGEAQPDPGLDAGSDDEVTPPEVPAADGRQAVEDEKPPSRSIFRAPAGATTDSPYEAEDAPGDGADESADVSADESERQHRDR